jgi:hypothetical protein
MLFFHCFRNLIAILIQFPINLISFKCLHTLVDAKHLEFISFVTLLLISLFPVSITHCFQRRIAVIKRIIANKRHQFCILFIDFSPKSSIQTNNT